VLSASADNWFLKSDTFKLSSKYEQAKVIAELNSTSSGGPYTYYRTNHRFAGQAYDGTNIDVSSNVCCGAAGSCRNNVACQCQVSVGPLPAGGYTIGNMQVFHNMAACYQLFPDASNNMCGRSGFFIHGGDCSGDPSEGCIVISDESTRYLIKSGAHLTVV